MLELSEAALKDILRGPFEYTPKGSKKRKKIKLGTAYNKKSHEAHADAVREVDRLMASSKKSLAPSPSSPSKVVVSSPVYHDMGRRYGDKVYRVTFGENVGSAELDYRGDAVRLWVSRKEKETDKYSREELVCSFHDGITISGASKLITAAFHAGKINFDKYGPVSIVPFAMDICPINDLKFSPTGWRRTVTSKDSAFLSDGRIMVLKDLGNPKNIKAIEKRSEYGGIATGEQRVWDASLDGANIELTPMNSGKTVDGEIAMFKGGNGQAFFCSAPVLKTFMGLCGRIDSWKTSGEKKAIVAFRGNKPVGVFMPMSGLSKYESVLGDTEKPASGLESMSASDLENLAVKGSRNERDLAARELSKRREVTKRVVGMDGVTRSGRSPKKKIPLFSDLPLKSQSAFNLAFDSRDAETMAGYLHTSNRGLRAEWEQRTGTKLPKTVGGTLKAVRDFFS